MAFVLSADVDSSPQTSNPVTVLGGANSTINFTVAVDSIVTQNVQRVDFNRPSDFTVFNCAVAVPDGWSCTKDNSDLIRFTYSTGIAAGSSVSFAINATAPSTTGNVSWTLDTYENTGGTLNPNSTIVNVTVDSDSPLIFAINLTDGNTTINQTQLADGATFFLKLTDLVFNVTITDVFDNGINGSIYYPLHGICTLETLDLSARYAPCCFLETKNKTAGCKG